MLSKEKYEMSNVIVLYLGNNRMISKFFAFIWFRPFKFLRVAANLHQETVIKIESRIF